MLRDVVGIEGIADSGAPADVTESVSSWHNLLSYLNVLPQVDISQVEVADDVIRIRASDADELAAIRDAIQDALRLPEALVSASGVTMYNADEPAAADSPPYLVPDSQNAFPPPPREDQGIAVMEQFFGPQITLFTGIHLVWREMFAEGPVLLSRHPASEIERNIWTHQVKAIVDGISKMPLHYLRQVYQDPATPMKFTLPIETDVHTVDADLFRRCFGTIDKEGKTYFYFDYKLMHSLLFPPEITVDISEAVEGASAAPGSVTDCCLTIDKKHLIAYLRQVFSSGLTMQLLEDGSNRAHPILLPSPFNQTVKPLIILMIDNSASMRSQRDEYVAKLQEMVVAIHDRVGDDAELMLVSFSDTFDIAKYLLSERDAIFRYFDQLKCDGSSTMIYGTLSQLLSEGHLNRYHPQQFNRNLILTTDGVDNTDTSVWKATLLRRLSAEALPQMFTLGLGAKHDVSLCSEFARTTGGRYQALTSVEQLSDLLRHLEEIAKPCDLVSFVDSVMKQFVSVYDNPVRLDPIREEDEFMVNGRRLRFNREVRPIEAVAPVVEGADNASAVDTGWGGWARSGISTLWATLPQSVRTRLCEEVGVLPSGPGAA